MSVEPTYPYRTLKVLTQKASLDELRVISVIVRKEKDLYSLADYTHSIIVISARLIVLSSRIK
jgi:hypothetical protein